MTASPEEPPVDDARPTATVVVPVYNEADYLHDLLPKLLAATDEVPAEITVLVVENGSTDGSGEIVAAMAEDDERIRLLQLPEANYGAAVRRGFEAATGDWVVVFDIDYFSGAFLRDALDQVEPADIVIASKRAPGSEDRRAPLRRLATWSLNALLRLVVGLQVSDTHGMKAVRRTVLEKVLADVVSVDDLFDTELVLRAERAGYTIVELPVIVEEERESRSRIWTRVPRTLAGIWRLRASLK